jgi:hypothetical protein
VNTYCPFAQSLEQTTQYREKPVSQNVRIDLHSTSNKGHGSTGSCFLLHDHQTGNYSDASLWVPGIVSSPAQWQHSTVPLGQLYGECQIFSPPSTGPASTHGLNLLTDLHIQNMLAILTVFCTSYLVLTYR